MNEELAKVLAATVEVADRLSSHTFWTPVSGSQAETEVTNAEVRPSGQPWGDRPVRTAYFAAGIGLKAAAEYARAMRVLLSSPGRPLIHKTMARAALEAAASSWWLLEAGLGARRRVCRLQLVRIKSAIELGKALTEVGLPSDGSTYGESQAQVLEYSTRLGLSPFTDRNGDRSAVCGTETRLGYTQRSKALLDDWKTAGAYNIYSGSAHAELYALLQMVEQTGSSIPDREPILEFAPDPEALHAAVWTALLAMIAPLERAALLFGWSADDLGPGAELSAAIDHVNLVMARPQRTPRFGS